MAEPAPWKAWYEKSQLNAGKGIRASPLSVFCWVLYVLTFYVLLTTKTHMMTVIFPTQGTILTKYLLAIAPPIVTSAIFCLVMPSLLEKCGFANFRLFTYTVAVLALDTGESFAEMWALMTLRWWNTIMAGLILKYALTSSLLVLVELFFRSKGPPREGPVYKFCSDGFTRWLLAHRMARDILVSILIFAPLSIFVFFDYVRRKILGFSPSFHNLLVYRDWGHPSHTSEEIGFGEARAPGYLADNNSFVEDSRSSFMGRRARGPLLSAEGIALPEPPRVSAADALAAADAAAPSSHSASPPRRQPAKLADRVAAGSGDSAEDFSVPTGAAAALARAAGGQRPNAVLPMPPPGVAPQACPERSRGADDDGDFFQPGAAAALSVAARRRAD